MYPMSGRNTTNSFISNSHPGNSASEIKEREFYGSDKSKRISMLQAAPRHQSVCRIRSRSKNRVSHAHLTHREHPVPVSAPQAQCFMLRVFPQPPCHRSENIKREITYVFLTYYISFLNIFSKSSSVACFGLPGAHASAAADSQRNGRSSSLSFSSFVGIPTSMES